MRGPLNGITVLDFTQAYNGPYGTMNLADYGARVIKVERMDGGDQSRFWSPYTDSGESGYFATYNRNKEGIAVDLRKSEGVELIKALYSKVDVVVENFKCGTMEKLGLGYEVANAINPGIIFASSTGFGQSGPLCRNTAYDNVIESMCGYMDMTGFENEPPLRSGASVGDSFTGLTTALGIVLACYAKKRTGKGQRIDVAMLDTMFATLDDAILTYALTGEEMSRTGNAKLHEVAPYDAYSCKEGGYLAVTVTEEWMWPEFCDVIGRLDMIEHPMYAANDLRCENIEALTEIIQLEMLKKTQEEWMKEFAKKRIPATKIYTPMEAMEHPQFLFRNMVIEIEDNNVGKMKSFGLPIKYSKTPGAIYKSSPRLGEDTVRVMEEAGYDQDKIVRMMQEGVVGYI